jgi:heat shock protein HslJ
MKRLLFSAFVLLLLASCGTSKNTNSTTNDDSPFDPEGDRQELVDDTWVFMRIYGNDIAGTEGRELPQLTFSEDGTFSGHTGCNPINGSYTLEDGLRIKFDRVASGLALCEDVTYEADLLEVINETDNYTLNDGVLSLNKARMAPMAQLVKK